MAPLNDLAYRDDYTTKSVYPNTRNEVLRLPRNRSHPRPTRLATRTDRFSVVDSSASASPFKPSAPKSVDPRPDSRSILPMPFSGDEGKRRRYSASANATSANSAIPGSRNSKPILWRTSHHPRSTHPPLPISNETLSRSPLYYLRSPGFALKDSKTQQRGPQTICPLRPRCRNRNPTISQVQQSSNSVPITPLPRSTSSTR